MTKLTETQEIKNIADALPWMTEVKAVELISVALKDKDMDFALRLKKACEESLADTDLPLVKKLFKSSTMN